MHGTPVGDARSSSIDRIRSRIEPLRTRLLEHRLYESLGTPANVRTFMEHHVFAVWDFMSLLKALQRRVCRVELPWVPPSDSGSCRLINDIVLGEESDEDGAGGHASHFELYLRSMRQCGADPSQVIALTDAVREGMTVEQSLEVARVPPHVKAFVLHTFDVIRRDNLPEMASAFTFGREDLLPEVFGRIVDDMNARMGGDLERFRHYLARHVELDGDRHGPMSEQLVANTCGDDPARWAAAGDGARSALESRLVLWDGIAQAIER